MGGLGLALQQGLPVTGAGWQPRRRWPLGAANGGRQASWHLPHQGTIAPFKHSDPDPGPLPPSLLQAPGYQDLLAPYPTVRAWLARVAARCEPHYSQVHALLHMVQGRLVARKEQRRQQAASRL